MEGLIHGLHEVIACGAEIAKLVLEGIGILILIIAGIQSTIMYFRKNPHSGLNLAKGISTALTFMLGGEVLGTIIATSWNNILMLGAIVVLRVTINFVLLWEIGHEEREEMRLMAKEIQKGSKSKKTEDE